MRITKKIDIYFTPEEVEKMEAFENLMEKLSDEFEEVGIQDDTADTVNTILDYLDTLNDIIREE